MKGNLTVKGAGNRPLCLNGQTGISGITFKTDPLTYLTRIGNNVYQFLVETCGCEISNVPPLVVACSQEAWERLYEGCRSRLGPARPPAEGGAFIFRGMRVEWSPECPEDMLLVILPGSQLTGFTNMVNIVAKVNHLYE